MAVRVSKEVIEQIRQALDIADVIGAYIQLKRAGNSAKALCPFHKEKTPSFHVNPARQAFHCFGCGVGGDVFKFVMLYENVDFPTALRLLADRAGIRLQFEESRADSKQGPAKDELFAVNEEASRRYQEELWRSPAAAAARSYLQARQLDTRLWKEWGIGYAPNQPGFLADEISRRGRLNPQALETAGLILKNEKGQYFDRFRDRLMFTIRDELGRAVGFSGRVLQAGAPGGKYVNTPETPVFRKSRLLYALDKAKREILDRHTALLVEGQIDCIRCHSCGFPHAVASQGTAFTEEHARLLQRYADHIIVVLDADEAGQKAALRTAELLLAEGLAVTLAALPENEDPDSLLRDKGPAAFAAVLNQGLTPIGFLIRRLQQQENLRTPQGLLRASRALLEWIQRAPTDIQAEQMLREAAAGLGLSMDALRRDWQRARRKKILPAPAGSPPATAEALAPPRPIEEVEMAILLGTENDPQLTAFVRPWLPEELLTDPDCRTVIRALLNDPDNLMAALAGEREECQRLAAEVVNAPRKVSAKEGELSAAQAARDLIIRLWQRHIERQIETIRQGLRTLSGPPREALLQEYAELLLDQKKLRGEWETVRPIIEIHLHRLARS